MINKKKIGIVTLHGYFNYGNKLQNYALKAILEKLNFEVSTTIVTDENLKKRMRYFLFKNEFKKSPIKKLHSMVKNKFIPSKEIPQIHKKREKIFIDFSKKHLNEQFIEISETKEMEKINTFDFFITGSDQVWNPIYYSMLPIYFLTFTDKEKRIAYAPSISRDSLPTEYKNDYKNWLSEMSKISVRENSGAEIIKDLTGINVPVLADPALLLTKEQWLEISKPAKNRPNKPYLLTYFLGGPTDSTLEQLEKIASEKDMEIINLGDIKDENTYATGPSEFIDYINNASAFFTDSFHGVVFSIILQTPFVVYERQYSGPSMYSRIETILDNFEMKDREANGFDKDIFSMDFSGTHEVLDKEYNKSVNYLKEAFGIEE